MTKTLTQVTTPVTKTPADPYRSAAELGVKEWEREGLIRAMDVIAQLPRFDGRPGSSFSIYTGCYDHECGTVACIGGWAYRLTHGHDSSAATAYVTSICGPGRSLKDLYYPNGVCWGRIEPKHAVRAIDNFLRYGEPRWREVCA